VKILSYNIKVTGNITKEKFVQIKNGIKLLQKKEEDATMN